jgi:hypothetical protein
MAQQQIVHERRPGQHRLVIFRGGIPQASAWMEDRQVGLYRGYYFHVGSAGETIPPVFRVSSVSHEVL